jgi:hypothetical protein
MMRRWVVVETRVAKAEEHRKYLYLCVDKPDDLRVLQNGSGLKLFNSLVTKHLAGDNSGKIYSARVQAFKELASKHPKEAKQLCECFRGLWPHWMDKECIDILKKLRYCEDLTPVKSQLQKLATMGSVRGMKRAGRRRGRGAVPNHDNECRNHPEKSVKARGLCATCLQRLKVLLSAGVIVPETDGVYVDKLLSIPIQPTGGRGVYMSKVMELRMKEGLR